MLSGQFARIGVDEGIYAFQKMKEKTMEKEAKAKFQSQATPADEAGGDLDRLIQKLQDAKLKYGNRPVVVEDVEADWYKSVDFRVDDEANPDAPVFVRFVVGQ